MIVLAVALGAAALLLSLVANSRVWLHSMGGLHVWYHLLLFGVLAALLTYVSAKPSTRLAWLLVLVLLGLAMEYGEMVRFDGYMEWNDVRTDTISVALGGLAGWLLQRWSSGKTPR